MFLPRIACLAAFCALAVCAQSPSITAGGVVNGASFAQGQAVAPGSVVTIFGTGLAAGLAQADSIPLSTALGDVTSVTFNDIPAPLMFVSQGQINAQVPWEVPAGQATVVVKRGTAASTGSAVPVAASSPGVFSIPAQGRSLAIAVNSDDGTLAQPENSIPGLNPPPEPARAGGALLIYATGLGPLDAPVPSGQNSMDRVRHTVTTPVVLIGGVQAQVLFSGLAPQFVGINQLNIVVPAGVPPGDAVPLQIQMDGVTSSDQVTIAVRP